MADALREAIITGQFEDGEELNQVELAEHFNVSRVPIREALRRLQAEGLVSAEAHRRATVVGLDQARAEEIFHVRALLEAFMLERSASVLSREDLAELSELCDRMDATPGHLEWLELNHRFHHQLLSPGGSPVSMALVERLSGQVERYLRRSGGINRAAEAGRQHRQIISALKRGDTERAKDVLSQHILDTWKRVSASVPIAAQTAQSGQTAQSAEAARGRQ